MLLLPSLDRYVVVVVVIVVVLGVVVVDYLDWILMTTLSNRGHRF
jgi:hypothetical protein